MAVPYTTIIGLEVHVQLLTKSKIFCGCANQFNPENPNVQTCPVCLGLPGSLPVMNREAFRLSVKTALALNCQIARFTKWDRKQYYYPDLPKGYQISQYDLPFSTDGWLEIEIDPEAGKLKRIGLFRVHLEEDAGKNMHDETGRGSDSRVDLNRAGTPLLEVVSKPDINSPQEARMYLDELKLLLTYLGVSDCNMQEGSLRCDANVNLHVHGDDGQRTPTPIVEIKNLNSFRGVELALEYEVKRQVDLWQQTGHRLGDVPKETRGWNADRSMTFAQRGKEEASDYRYFPDPDLVSVAVSDSWIDAIKAETCELPAQRRSRFRTQYGLSPYDASVVVEQGNAFADYFEDIAKASGDGKQAANWVTQDVLREMNERNVPIGEFPIRPSELSVLLKKISDKQITNKSAREVFAELLTGVETGVEVSSVRMDRIIDDKGLALVTDTGELSAVIDAVIAGNKEAVTAFQAGKQGAVGPLIGQVMSQVKGADPKMVRQMLINRLSS